MKRINLLAKTAALTTLLLFTFNFSNAQMTAYASVGATIVSPITLEQESELELVRLTESEDNTGRQGHDLITPASFSVSGSPHSIYGILVPPAVSVARGSDIITMRTTATHASGNGVLSDAGKDGLLIFSTQVANTQEPHVSEAGHGMLPVTVVYN